MAGRDIPAVSVVTTKLADGNVLFVFMDSHDGLNPYAAVKYAVVMTTANVTAINTTVNGGATGATLTQTYAQNAAQGDYPPNVVTI